MILRKPYAFLIKRFKLLHFILTGILIYLAYKISFLYKYFNTYSISTSDKILASKYISILMYVAGLGIIIFSIVVFFLMRFKKKPRLLYLITIFGSIISFVLLSYNYSILTKLETTYLDSRTIMLVRDLDLVLLIYHYIMIALMGVRALGFDIKKFNFSEDLEELQIDEKDNEEFEFVVGVDTNKILRKYRRKKREFKYVIIENKLIFSILGIFIVGVIGLVVGMKLLIVNREYTESQTFRASDLIVTVHNSYLTNKSYDNSILLDDGSMLLVLKITVKSPYNYSVGLDKNKFRVVINNNKYHPILNYCQKLYDIGECYYDQDITKDEKKLIMVYNIKKEDITSKKIELTYVNQILYKTSGLEGQYKIVELKPININTPKLTDTKNLNEEIDFVNSFVYDNKLTINNIELKDLFLYNYDYCLSEKCSSLNGVITSDNVKTYKRTILKLDYNFVSSETFKIKPNKLIEDYGLIKYVIGDKEYEHNVKIVDKTPNNYSGSSVFFEVLDDLKNASKISLEFNIRNKKYLYILKK